LTNIYLLPLRHPIATARMAVTLDRVSRGRFTLGVGVGWLEEEFAALDQTFRNRGSRTDEIIPVLRRLWSEDTIEHHGEHYDFGPVAFLPKPTASPSIPIEIGGSSPAALRRAGRLGDGWIEIGATDLDDVREHNAVVQEARREAGRDEVPFEITLSAALASDLSAIKRAEELGVTRVIAGYRGAPDRPALDEHKQFIEDYAENVMTRFEPDDG
jgi:probable F420-dependent oxidoreductase